MAASVFVTPAFAAETADAASGTGETTGDGDTSSSLTDIKALLSIMSYEEYKASYKNAEYPDETVKIDVTEYDVENSSENVKLLENYKGKDYAVETGESGKVTFKFNVSEAGFYNLRLDYVPTESQTTTNIERTLYVNGEVPFSEARNLSMSKRWASEYTEQADGKLRFELDANGNEIRPDKNVEYVWQEYVFYDYNGYYSEPLVLYFEEGENTIAFESTRHGAIFADIELFKYDAPKSYEDVMAEYEKKGYKNATGEPIYIDAETPTAVSSNSIYPDYDSVSSFTEPQSAKATIRNMIGTASAGQWLEYDFYVEESAVYTLMFRFRQNSQAAPVSRKLVIDGEVPYDMAEAVKFEFGENWQTAAAGDGDREFKVYLEKGHHTLRIEVSLGEVGEMIRSATEIQSAFNADYLEILRLTGASPDEYRNYGFSRVMPHVMRDLVDQANALYAIVDALKEGGQLSQDISTLTQIADRAYKMGTDESQIAKNLDGLKSDMSTLASWVSGMASQGLAIDYIRVQSPEAEIPKAEAGFFAGAWFEIQKFISSFYVDYNSLSDTGSDKNETKESPVEVWTASSRDQAQIIKNLASESFTTGEKIPVNVKLVIGGTLLPSILAGIGPDVALDGMTSTNTAIANTTGSIVDYAVRGSIIPLQNLEGFEDVKARFPSEAFQPISLYGDVYGIPTSLDWNMMFYRKDILATLDVDIPETWDDIMALVPELQFNNMEVGLMHDTSAYAMYIFQNGGQFWADEGMRVNFDSNTSLEAFEYMSNMFTQYSLPYAYDPLNRFKTGEMPLFTSSYIMYNTITVYATEIAGLWGFTAMPGTYDDDGNLNRSTVGSVDAVCMIKDCENVDNAWKFIKWYTDKDCQVDLSNELITLLGESGFRAVANLDAIKELQWKEDDRNALLEQIKDVKCLPQYPGSYFISRYVTFATNNAYNEGADPVEQMLGYVSAINKEISRKRKEFGYETLEVGQTLAEKRLDEATQLLNDLSDSDAETYKSAIADARDAIESADLAALTSSASKLKSANGELFKTVAEKLTQAVAAFETYDN